MASGIYRIDGPNGRVYIGSAVNINKRFYWHKSMLNNLDKRKMYAVYSEKRHMHKGWRKFNEEVMHESSGKN